MPLICDERPKTGEFVGTVHILLDDIERKIVKARKAPDRDKQQKANLQFRMFDYKQGGGEKPAEEKQEPLNIDDSPISDIFHHHSPLHVKRAPGFPFPLPPGLACLTRPVLVRNGSRLNRHDLSRHAFFHGCSVVQE